FRHGELDTQLGSITDVELAVHATEVILDGAPGDEQFGGSFRVRGAARHDHGDIEFTRGQFSATYPRGGSPLAARHEFRAGLIGPGRRPETFETVDSSTQMRARIA